MSCTIFETEKAIGHINNGRKIASKAADINNEASAVSRITIDSIETMKSKISTGISLLQQIFCMEDNIIFYNYQNKVQQQDYDDHIEVKETGKKKNKNE